MKCKEDKIKKIKSEFEHSDFGEIEIKDIPRVKKLSSSLFNEFLDNYTTCYKP
jgi:pyruvate dehydrogenase E2 component (dihydrolipoamide acetyltransferase)